MVTITVQSRESVLEYRAGRLTRVLAPRRHRRRVRARYLRTDLRTRLTQAAPQEVLSADGPEGAVRSDHHGDGCRGCGGRCDRA